MSQFPSEIFHFAYKLFDSFLDFGDTFKPDFLELGFPESLDGLESVQDLELFDGFQSGFLGILNLEVLQVASFDVLELWVFTVVVEKTGLRINNLFFNLFHHFLSFFLFGRSVRRQTSSILSELLLNHSEGIFRLNRLRLFILRLIFLLFIVLFNFAILIFDFDLEFEIGTEFDFSWFVFN